MSDELPPLPPREVFLEGASAGSHYALTKELEYRLAEANAYLARLRVAVEALRLVADWTDSDIAGEAIREALAAIGPLPGEGK